MQASSAGGMSLAIQVLPSPGLHGKLQRRRGLALFGVLTVGWHRIGGAVLSSVTDERESYLADDSAHAMQSPPWCWEPCTACPHSSPDRICWSLFLRLCVAQLLCLVIFALLLAIPMPDPLDPASPQDVRTHALFIFVFYPIFGSLGFLSLVSDVHYAAGYYVDLEHVPASPSTNAAARLTSFPATPTLFSPSTSPVPITSRISIAPKSLPSPAPAQPSTSPSLATDATPPKGSPPSILTALASLSTLSSTALAPCARPLSPSEQTVRAWATTNGKRYWISAFSTLVIMHLCVAWFLVRVLPRSLLSLCVGCE
jgi:hypothetical protein